MFGIPMHTGISQLFRRLFRDRRGSTVTFVAAAAVPLIAFSGLAIDTARGYLAKQRLAYAIEAAALAAAKSTVNATNAEIKEVADRYFKANFPEGALGSKDISVTYTISPNKREITATASVEIETALMSVVGIDEVTVSTQATALRESKGLELAIALDNTGSMGCCIGDLQDAMELLLATLYGENDTVENLWVAVLPFDTRVNLWRYRNSVLNFSVPWNPQREVCANARTTEPYDTDDTAPDSADPDTLFSSRYTGTYCDAERARALTAERSTIEDTIDDMDAEGKTRIDEAAAWTFRMLSPKWRGLWGDPDLPLDYDTPLMDKAAIIMTDGENNPESGSASDADARLLKTCTSMKNRNIIVYTVLYKDDTEALKTLMRTCATSSSHYFYAEEDDLGVVFNEIANQLSNLRLLSVQ